ncbi:MAG: alkyl sulfatase C-terminal domain-containing protein, partial [Pseudomonadales bacterium]|nr:alkyl sulfatase C-terminal domain-containing protein [Pseudomonadales bacterium]
LNGPRADGLVMHLNLEFTDNEPTLLSIENSVLHAFAGKQHSDPSVTLKMSELNFKFMMTGNTDAMALLESGDLEMSGDFEALAKFRELFDQFERRFPLVTPRKPWG